MQGVESQHTKDVLNSKPKNYCRTKRKYDKLASYFQELGKHKK